MGAFAYVASFGISTIASYIFIDTFFVIKEKYKNREKLLYILYFLISMPIIMYFDNPNINVITHITCQFIIVQFYEGNLSKRLAITVLIYATRMVIDGSIYSMLNASSTFSRIIEMNLSMVIISTTVLFTSISLRKYLNNYAKIKENENINYGLMATVPLASISILTVTLKGGYDSITVAPIAVALLIINMSSYIVIGYILRLTGEAYKVGILELENKSYYSEFQIREEKNTNIRRLKHDMNNHMLTIKSLTRQHRYEELATYIKSYEIELQESEIFANTDNVAFDNIINTKLNKAVSMGAKIDADINVEGLINIPAFDMVIILGNILDNMLEAIEKVEDKYIYVLIEKKLGLLRIMASNTFNGEIDIKEYKLITKKDDKENHGIGLSNVERIIQKYNGDIEVGVGKNNNFVVDLSLYEQ